jgi:hypothetical protein
MPKSPTSAKRPRKSPINRPEKSSKKSSGATSVSGPAVSPPASPAKSTPRRVHVIKQLFDIVEELALALTAVLPDCEFAWEGPTPSLEGSALSPEALAGCRTIAANLAGFVDIIRSISPPPSPSSPKASSSSKKSSSQSAYSPASKARASSAESKARALNKALRDIRFCLAQKTLISDAAHQAQATIADYTAAHTLAPRALRDYRASANSVLWEANHILERAIRKSAELEQLDPVFPGEVPEPRLPDSLGPVPAFAAKPKSSSALVDPTVDQPAAASSSRRRG